MWIILWRQQEYGRFFIHQLSDHRGRSQFSHFSFRDCKTFSIHLEEYGCMANLWNYSTLSSLPYPCLTPPPSYFSTLPPPYFTPLPSPPSASFILRFDFLCFNTNLECFLFVRTDRPDHFYHNENFTFNQNYPARSLSHILNSLHWRDSFQQTLFEKANFIFKLTGSIMVRPPTTDVWKSPLVARMLYCRKFTGLIPRCPD